jgi:tRNA-dihydrouridine synthase
VREPLDAVNMIRRTGCAGVMIGRGALSTPWIFNQCWHFMQTGEQLAPPDEATQLAIIRRYFGLMRQYRDDRYALFQINRRVSWFARHLQRTLPNGKLESVKPFKEAIRVSRTAEAVLEALAAFEAGELRGGIEAADAANASLPHSE